MRNILERILKHGLVVGGLLMSIMGLDMMHSTLHGATRNMRYGMSDDHGRPFVINLEKEDLPPQDEPVQEAENDEEDNAAQEKPKPFIINLEKEPLKKKINLEKEPLPKEDEKEKESAGECASNLEKEDENEQQGEEGTRLPQMQTISAFELLTLLGKLEADKEPVLEDTIIVNVLGAKYYDDCHIPGSISVPLYDLCSKAHEWVKQGWDTTKAFVVYCALDECDASEKAYYMLKGMGFTKVKAYEGGMREWFLLGHPICGPCAYDYLQADWLADTRTCVCLGMCSLSLDEVRKGILPARFQ